MLRVLQVFQVLPNCSFPTPFVGLHSLAESPTPKRFPGRQLALWAQRQCDQNRQHHKQGLGQPERQKDFEEKSSHPVSLPAFSRGREKM